MHWVSALLTLAVICAIGVVVAAILIWPLDRQSDDEHEDAGVG